MELRKSRFEAAICADAMGLGKTGIAIAIDHITRAEGGPTVLVTTKSLMENHLREMQGRVARACESCNAMVIHGFLFQPVFDALQKALPEHDSSDGTLDLSTKTPSAGIRGNNEHDREEGLTIRDHGIDVTAYQLFRSVVANYKVASFSARVRKFIQLYRDVTRKCPDEKVVVWSQSVSVLDIVEITLKQDVYIYKQPSL